MALVPTPTLPIGATAISTATASCTTAVPDTNGQIPQMHGMPIAAFPRHGKTCRVRSHMWFGDRCAPCTGHRCKKRQWPQDVQNSLPIYGVCCNFSQPCCWLIVVGAPRACIGFILRTVGADDQQNLTYDAVNSLFLLTPLCEISESVPERRIFLISYFSGKKTFTCMVVARLICFLHPRRQALQVSARWLRRALWLQIN